MKHDLHQKCLFVGAIIIILLYAIPYIAYGATYYVKPTGVDSLSGTSLDSAWQHIVKACTTLVAGDTAFIADGTYTEDSWDTTSIGGFDVQVGLVPENNGTDGNPIVFKGYNAIPIIIGLNGTADSATAGPFRGNVLTGSNYITYDSIEFRFGRRGLFATSSRGITVKNCIIDSTIGGNNNNNGGIITFLNDLNDVVHLNVSNCEIFANGQWGTDRVTEEYENGFNTGGIWIYNCDSCNFFNNNIHHQHSGIKIKGPLLNGSDSNITHNIRIYDNILYEIDDAGIWVVSQGYQYDIEAHHNLIYDVGNSGLVLNIGAVDGSGDDILFYNNTVDCGGVASGIKAQFADADNCSTFNNIFFNPTLNVSNYGGGLAFKNEGGSPVGYYDDYNLYYGRGDESTGVYFVYPNGTGYTLAGWQTEYEADSGWGGNSIIDDPLFTDTSANDYRLQSGSPAATGGRGGIYPTYMGAEAPVGGYPTVWADTSVLTDDSLPYTVSDDNRLLLISGTVTTVEDGITMVDKDSIGIEISGTFSFGTNGNSYAKAININGGRLIKIFGGGSILHDVDADEDDSVINCDAIMMDGAGDSILIRDLRLMVKGCGVDTCTEIGDTSNADGANCIDSRIEGYGHIEIRNVNCSTLVHSIDTRTEKPSAAMKLFSSAAVPGDGEYDIIVDSCRVPECNHVGIVTSSEDVLNYPPRLYITHNYIKVDANTVLWPGTVGDAAAISIRYSMEGSIIRANTIRAGTDHWGGQGLLIEGMRGTSENPNYIDSNDFVTGYGGTSGGSNWALYVRWNSGGNKVYNCYNYIRHNTFTTYGDKNAGTDCWPADIQTVRIHADSGFQGNKWNNNRVFAIQVDSVDGQVDMVDRGALQLAMMDSLRVERTDLGTETYDVRNNEFYYNYYYSNYGDPIDFGSKSNWLMGGGGIVFYGDTIYRGEDESDSAAIVFGTGGTPGYSSTNSRLIDCIFLGAAKDTVVFNTITEDDDGWGKDLSFERIITLDVDDSEGDPVDGANVWIIDNYGDTLLATTTDASGNAVDTVRYAKYHYDSPSPDPSYSDSLSYSPLIYKAKSGTDSIADTLAVTATSSGTVNLDLPSGGGGGSSGNKAMWRK